MTMYNYDHPSAREALADLLRVSPQVMLERGSGWAVRTLIAQQQTLKVIVTFRQWAGLSLQDAKWLVCESRWALSKQLQYVWDALDQGDPEPLEDVLMDKYCGSEVSERVAKMMCEIFGKRATRGQLLQALSQRQEYLAAELPHHKEVLELALYS